MAHTPIPTDQVHQQDKTIIVTGATSGLGLEAARHLARLGASKLILAWYGKDRGEAARQSIEKSTGRHGTIEVWEVDLTEYHTPVLRDSQQG